MNHPNMLHLDAGSLEARSSRLPVPSYDRSATEPFILHMGVADSTARAWPRIPTSSSP